MDAGCSAADAGASDPGPPPVDPVGGGAAAARIEGAGAVPVPRDGEQRDAGAVRGVPGTTVEASGATTPQTTIMQRMPCNASQMYPLAQVLRWGRADLDDGASLLSAVLYPTHDPLLLVCTISHRAPLRGTPKRGQRRPRKLAVPLCLLIMMHHQPACLFTYKYKEQKKA
ncbi:hypothetical protein EJB05_22431, partial [Eragrostis curvula]